MTTKRKEEIEDLKLILWKARRKIAEIRKAEDEEADGIDEEEDYFRHRFVRETAEILHQAEEFCEKVEDKLDMATEDYVAKE